MKNKKDGKVTPLKVIEIVIKTLIILGLLSGATAIITAFVAAFMRNDKLYLLGFIFIGVMMAIGAIIGILILTINIQGYADEDSDDYKIKSYDCTLEVDISERMAELYGEVKYSEFFPENYYCTYHKEFEVVIIAVMYVDSTFSEDEFVAYMNEIPEVDEQILSHTLIVIFIEKEKSAYLHEIMYCPEYNSLYDTKIFSVFDREKNKLKVNKTDSGTGDKAYNDARKVLNYIFTFKKKEKSIPDTAEDGENYGV